MRELEREKTGNEAEIPALAIIGAGRVGSALHRAADTAGIEARLAGRFDAAEACVGAELALLCVPDAAIEEHSQELAELYRVLAERTRALAGADAEVTA